MFVYLFIVGFSPDYPALLRISPGAQFVITIRLSRALQACGRECGVRFEMCDAIGMTDVHLVCVECFSGVTNRSGPVLSAEDVSPQSSPVDQPS